MSINLATRDASRAALHARAFRFEITAPNVQRHRRRATRQRRRTSADIPRGAMVTSVVLTLPFSYDRS